jgi:CHASE1-domain containing sensor protein
MGRRVVGSSGAVASGPADRLPSRLKRIGAWGLIAGLLATGGVAGTVFAARSVSRADFEKSRQAFSQASIQIASTLRLAIAREKDLVVGAAVFDLENPHATNADFRRWVREEGAFQSHPELEAARLWSFRVAFDPITASCL